MQHGRRKKKTAARVHPVRAALAGMVLGSAVLQKEKRQLGQKDPDGRRTDRLKGEGPRGEGLKIEEPKPGDR